MWGGSDRPHGSQLGVVVKAVPDRRDVSVLRPMPVPDSERVALREVRLPLKDYRLADRRVVFGAWDEVERVLYVWRPHLGLYGHAIVHALAADLANGKVEAPRAASDGAALDHAQEATADASNPISATPETSASGRGTDIERPRVIVVEDDELVARTVQRMLEQAGFVVIVINSPFEFKRVLERERPHLALIDVRLPAISGDALVQFSQVMPNRTRCPMVLFSSMPLDVLSELARISGAAGFVHKSNGFIDLADRIRGFIQAA